MSVTCVLLAVVGSLSFTLSPSDAALVHAADGTEVHLSVFLRDAPADPLSLESVAVQDVSELLLPFLGRLSKGSLAIEMAEAYLGLFFVTVVEEEPVPHYKTRWCEDIQDFKLVCCEAGELIVFHPYGAVVVVIEEATLI